MSNAWNIVQGMWKQIKGDARAEWGKLTDDDWDQVAGNRDKFLGRIQETYGWEKAEAERKIDDWYERNRRSWEQS